MARTTANRRPTNRRLVVTNSGISKETVVLPEDGGTVGRVRFSVAPWTVDDRGRKLISNYLIDENIVSMRWREDAEVAGVEVDIEINNKDNFARTILAPGNWIFPQFLDPTTKKWRYFGPALFVWSRSESDNNTLTSNVVCMDEMGLLQQQGPQDWFFKKDKKHPKGWRADQIAAKILYDLEVPAKLFRTDYYLPYFYVKNHTPYEALVKAYTRDRQISQIRYRVQALGKKVVVLPYLKQSKRWEVTEGSNIISTERVESLEGLYTELIVLSRGQNFIHRGVRVVSGNVRRYGRRRKVITFDNNVRQSVLKATARILLSQTQRTQREVRVTAQGLLPLRATEAIYLRDTGAGLAGNFFVKSIIHNFINGEHTMDLVLSTTDIVPALYPSVDELRPSQSDATQVAATAIGVGQQVSDAAQAVGAAATTVASGNASIADSAALVSQLDQYLRRKNSPLAGLGGTMVSQGRQYGVDPRMAVAVAGAETSFGTTGSAVALKNAWGLGPGIAYRSWPDAIGAFFRTIKNLAQGTNGTIPEIQRKYAPSGAANDPTGLNNNWVRNTSGVYAELGGNPQGSVLL